MDWLNDGAVLRRSHERSQDAARAWRAGPAYRALAEAFERVEPGDADAAARTATALFERDDLVGALLAGPIASLAGDPLFEPPLRVHRDGLRIGAVLFEAPAVSITASVMSASALARLPPAASVVMPGRLSVVRYHRARGAWLRQWRAEPVSGDFERASAAHCVPAGTLPLADGVVLRLDGRTRGSLIEGATSDVVTLTAMIRYGAAPLMREYSVPDVALVRSATLDDGASRTQMLLTLLRLSGRADAGDCFDAATRDGAFFLRWAAMREWLAVDVVAALPRLREMAAADGHHEVRAAAAATLPMVSLRLEEARCPG